MAHGAWRMVGICVELASKANSTSSNYYDDSLLTYSAKTSESNVQLKNAIRGSQSELPWVSNRSDVSVMLSDITNSILRYGLNAKRGENERM